MGAGASVGAEECSTLEQDIRQLCDTGVDTVHAIKAIRSKYKEKFALEDDEEISGLEESGRSRTSIGRLASNQLGHHVRKHNEKHSQSMPRLVPLPLRKGNDLAQSATNILTHNLPPSNFGTPTIVVPDEPYPQNNLLSPIGEESPAKSSNKFGLNILVENSNAEFKRYVNDSPLLSEAPTLEDEDSGTHAAQVAQKKRAGFGGGGGLQINCGYGEGSSDPGFFGIPSATGEGVLKTYGESSDTDGNASPKPKKKVSLSVYASDNNMLEKGDEMDVSNRSTSVMVGNFKIQESGLSRIQQMAPAPLKLQPTSHGALNRQGSANLNRSQSIERTGVPVSVNAVSLGGGYNFVEIAPLGAGASGSVVEAVHIPTLTLVALKMLPCYSIEKRENIAAELAVLYKNLAKMSLVDEFSDRGSDKHLLGSCPYILHLYDAFANPKTGLINLVVEYMDGGSLADLVKNGGCQDEAVLQDITFQICEGVNYLHNTAHQMHRDIKPGNILLNCKGQIKLADFGISKALDSTAVTAGTKDNKLMPGKGFANSFVGTMTYMSPERIVGDAYGYASDIWSVGLTLLAVAAGKFPITSPDNLPLGYWAMIKAVCDDPSPVPGPDFSDCFSSFIDCCLQKDPLVRGSSEELVKHPFVTSRGVGSSSSNKSRGPVETESSALAKILETNTRRKHSKAEPDIYQDVSIVATKLGGEGKEGVMESGLDNWEKLDLGLNSVDQSGSGEDDACISSVRLDHLECILEQLEHILVVQLDQQQYVYEQLQLKLANKLSDKDTPTNHRPFDDVYDVFDSSLGLDGSISSNLSFYNGMDHGAARRHENRNSLSGPANHFVPLVRASSVRLEEDPDYTTTSVVPKAITTEALKLSASTSPAAPERLLSFGSYTVVADQPEVSINSDQVEQTEACDSIRVPGFESVNDIQTWHHLARQLYLPAELVLMVAKLRLNAVYGDLIGMFNLCMEIEGTVGRDGDD